MTNDRLINTEAANDSHAPAVHGRDKPLTPKKPRDDQLESLSIDENDDFGGDPYNHTGSFYAPKFDEKFDD